jgi:hypothetical protein
MGVQEFMSAAEGAIQGALEALLKSVERLNGVPRPLFKVVMEKVREKGKELFPLTPLEGGLLFWGDLTISEIEYIPSKGEPRHHLVLGVYLADEKKDLKAYLRDVLFRIEPRSLQWMSRKILSRLPSETPKEALRVVEALEAWAERARELLREVEAEYAATLEREKEALEALRLKAAIRGLAEE